VYKQGWYGNLPENNEGDKVYIWQWVILYKNWAWINELGSCWLQYHWWGRRWKESNQYLWVHNLLVGCAYQQKIQKVKWSYLIQQWDGVKHTSNTWTRWGQVSNIIVVRTEENDAGILLKMWAECEKHVVYFLGKTMEVWIVHDRKGIQTSHFYVKYINDEHK
jgi:hypothetical protein